MTPYYSQYTDAWSVQYYEFRDGNGTEYHLDETDGAGGWYSKESAYVSYDSNTQRLYFNDGSFWVFGCVSSSAEPDAGTMYPTLLEDSNGNQISISYEAGQLNEYNSNSSSRIEYIDDVRDANYNNTYTFRYTNVNGAPHLSEIDNSVGEDSYSFSYSEVPLASPFSGSGSYGTTDTLSSITSANANLTTSFSYDSANSGELLKAAFPYGGSIRWEFETVPYTGQGSQREVAARYLFWDSAIGERAYTLQRTGTDQTASRSVTDQNANSTKTWNFTPGQVLVASVTQGPAGGSPLDETNYSWAINGGGNAYVSRIQDIADPGTPQSVTRQVDQAEDQYG
ncbi:MAG: hypothetical protein ACRD4O_06500, partial [Bryobacteraceae bacterium]